MFSFNDAGFTMIELMLGIIIIALVLSPIFVFFSNSMSITRQAKGRSQALIIAKLALEEMKGTAYSDWEQLEAKAVDFNLEHKAFKNFSSLNKDYRLKVELLQLQEGLKELQACVFWENDTRELKLITLVTDR